MKKFSRLLLIVFVLVLLPISAYFLFVIDSAGATIDVPQEKVIYNLPYPGILSDNPLYFLKVARDYLTEFLTRDNVKKAQLYLLDSDKRVAMAMVFVKMGKNSQSIEAFSKGEKYFLKIIPLLQDAKKQGSSAPSSFVETLKLSNAKHKELILELLKTLPQGLNDQINQIGVINTEIKHGLDKL